MWQNTMAKPTYRRQHLTRGLTLLEGERSCPSWSREGSQQAGLVLEQWLRAYIWSRGRESQLEMVEDFEISKPFHPSGTPSSTRCTTNPFQIVSPTGDQIFTHGPMGAIFPSTLSLPPISILIEDFYTFSVEDIFLITSCCLSYSKVIFLLFFLG